MHSLFKLSDAVNLAMHAAAILASLPERFVSAGHLAERLDASEATLAKAMQRLVRAGLVRSSRGPSGGFHLARQASSITLKEVFEAVEGPLDASPCLFGSQVCGRHECMLGESLAFARAVLIERLERTTLDQVPIPLSREASPVERDRNA